MCWGIALPLHLRLCCMGAACIVCFTRHSTDITCYLCRLIPRYDAHTEEAQFLRGGEGEAVGGTNRVSARPSEEMAELGRQRPAHSSGYQVEEVRRPGATQEMAERRQEYPSGYPAFTPGNAVHPQPAPAQYAGTAAPLGVQHSIPL